MAVPLQGIAHCARGYRTHERHAQVKGVGRMGGVRGRRHACEMGCDPRRIHHGFNHRSIDFLKDSTQGTINPMQPIISTVQHCDFSSTLVFIHNMKRLRASQHATTNHQKLCFSSSAGMPSCTSLPACAQCVIPPSVHSLLVSGSLVIVRVRPLPLIPSGFYLSLNSSGSSSLLMLIILVLLCHKICGDKMHLSVLFPPPPPLLFPDPCSLSPAPPASGLVWMPAVARAALPPAWLSTMSLWSRRR